MLSETLPTASPVTLAIVSLLVPPTIESIPMLSETLLTASTVKLATIPLLVLPAIEPVPMLSETLLSSMPTAAVAPTPRPTTAFDAAIPPPVAKPREDTKDPPTADDPATELPVVVEAVVATVAAVEAAPPAMVAVLPQENKQVDKKQMQIRSGPASPKYPKVTLPPLRFLRQQMTPLLSFLWL
jgi:hypothetical protein